MTADLMHLFDHAHLSRVLPSARGLVLDHCRNKNVLSVAFADTSLSRERLRAGRWLNQRLYEAAHQLWNVYIDDAGLEFNARDATIDALHVSHAGQIGVHRDLARQRFDVIVAFDVLEQLGHPGAFLDSIQHLMLPARTELVIGLPNVLRSAARCALRGLSPRVAHHAELTYPALTSLMREHGLRLEDTPLVRNAHHPSLPARVASRAIWRIVPYLSDGALVVATRAWP